LNTKAIKAVRCAIYTRVSTDQGLDQDFNSLDAQYDASQPGGMSYTSVLSGTARACSPLVLGEHGRSRVFCGEYPATPS